MREPRTTLVFRVDCTEHAGPTRSGRTSQQEIGIDSLLMVDMMIDLETGLEFTFESMDMPRNPDLDAIVDMVERDLARTSAS